MLLQNLNALASNGPWQSGIYLDKNELALLEWRFFKKIFNLVFMYTEGNLQGCNDMLNFLISL